MKRPDIEKALIALGSEYKDSELTDVQVKEVSEKIKLSNFERKDLEQFLLSGADLTNVPVNQILEHYLKGSETLQLIQMFPNVTAGQICYLKIRHKWPELRQAFLEDLKYSTLIKAQMAKNQTISFLSDIVTTFMRKHQPALIEYVLSGGIDDKNLPARFKLNDFKKLQQYLKLIQTVSEIKENTNNNQEDSDGHPVIQINTNNVEVNKSPDLEQASMDAADLLKRLYSTKKDEEANK